MKREHQSQQSSKPAASTQLHARSKHLRPYDFPQLILSFPPLNQYLLENKRGQTSINFFDPKAVKALNTALLKYHYQVQDWTFPAQYLCPPIPGRADYLHHLADLLASCNNKKIPRGKQINCLDIGVGANCIYPILGQRIYGWSFIGSDIDPKAVEAATQIVVANEGLREQVEIRRQPNPKQLLNGVWKKGEYIDLLLCNPPFHASKAAAETAAKRKLKNLTGKKINRPVLNFGGQQHELWCAGGERKFIQTLIKESQSFATRCFWFTSLVSKEANLIPLQAYLQKTNINQQKVISMGQGNKKSRLLAWTFLNQKQQKSWSAARWR